MAICLLSATLAANHQTGGPDTFLQAALLFGLYGLVLLLFIFGLIMLVRARYRRQKGLNAKKPIQPGTDPWREAGRRVMPDDYQPRLPKDHNS